MLRTGVVHSHIKLHPSRGGFDLTGGLHFNEARDPDGDHWRCWVKEADLVAIADGCAIDYDSVAFKEAKSAREEVKFEKKLAEEEKTTRKAGASAELKATLKNPFNGSAKIGASASRQGDRTESLKRSYTAKQKLSLVTLHFREEGRHVTWSMRPSLADTKECIDEWVAVLHGEWLGEPDVKRLGHVTAQSDDGHIELFLEIREVVLSRWYPREGLGERVAQLSLSKAMTKRFSLGRLRCHARESERRR